jgi:hypothetical protein
VARKNFPEAFFSPTIKRPVFNIPQTEKKLKKADFRVLTYPLFGGIIIRGREKR